MHLLQRRGDRWVVDEICIKSFMRTNVNVGFEADAVKTLSGCMSILLLAVKPLIP
jgi:hypothetical protein